MNDKHDFIRDLVGKVSQKSYTPEEELERLKNLKMTLDLDRKDTLFLIEKKFEFSKLTKEEHQILNYYCYDDFLYNTDYDKWEYFIHNQYLQPVDINYLTFQRYDADWEEFQKLFHFLRNSEKLFPLYVMLYSMYSFPPDFFNEALLPDMLLETKDLDAQEEQQGFPGEEKF